MEKIIQIIAGELKKGDIPTLECVNKRLKLVLA